MAATGRSLLPTNTVIATPPTLPTAPPLKVFDRDHYLALIDARAKTISRVVKKLKPALALATAVDAGAGTGFFSQTLEDCGLTACGFDARAENTAEARRRFPNIPFEQGDLQDRSILQLGKFDLVLCFGLLYHLENPLLAIRHLRALTGKCLLVESMCVPDGRPALLLREEPREDDQGLTDVAYYPSEDGLIKMLYRAGFALVYRVTPLPDHDDFQETPEHRRRRTVLLACSQPIDEFGFRLCLESREMRDPWAKPSSLSAALARRARRFVTSPLKQKYLSFARRARRTFPKLSIPWLLGFGAWWLAEDGELDTRLLEGGFEPAEINFVKKLLRPGMTVLDIGAHHGLYTLLASRSVGRHGQVIAIEPSPRERLRLKKHLRINRCSNVVVESYAAGNQNGEADLFVVNDSMNWGNSLRPPALPQSTHEVCVATRRIDDVLDTLGISRVDFIKLDVEGGELAALQGATRLLKGASRPAILVEVQDLRTRPWGYHAREIVQHLVSLDYLWFVLGPGSGLQPLPPDLETYDANLVALPAERAQQFQDLLKPGPAAAPVAQEFLLKARKVGADFFREMTRVRPR